jgi:hypothetical protein
MRLLNLVVLTAVADGLVVRDTNIIASVAQLIQTYNLESYCEASVSVSGLSSGTNVNVNVNANSNIQIPSQLAGYSSEVIQQGILDYTDEC